VPDATETLVKGLRAWTRHHDSHVRAAVELLIWHGDGFWLRRRDFTDTFGCVTRGRGEAWIDWRAARAFADAGGKASTSEMAILDLAVALGEDRYRLNIMGHAHSKAIARAVAQAVGEEGFDGS
jgi:hypothetical protein